MFKAAMGYINSVSTKTPLLLFCVVITLLLLFARVSRFKQSILLNWSSSNINELANLPLTKDGQQPIIALNNLERSLKGWVAQYEENRRLWRNLAIVATWKGDEVNAAIYWAETLLTNQQLATKGRYAREGVPHIAEVEDPRIWYEIGTYFDSDVRDFWYYRGNFLEVEGAVSGAKRYYERALEAEDSFEIGLSQTHLKLAELNRTLGLTTIALGHIEQALTVDDFENATQLRVRAYFLQGELFNQLGHYHLALMSYAVVLELQEDHYMALVRSGQLSWSYLHDSDRAVSVLKQAVANDHELVMGYKALANVYCENGQARLAYANYELVLKRQPTDQLALSRLQSNICNRNR